MSAAASSSRRRLLAHLLLVGVTLVWGATFPVVKAALRDASPLVFNCLRMTLAALLLLVANLPSLRRLNRRQWQLCGTAGFFLALGYELQTSGLATTTPSRSAFLTGLVVVLVPLLAAIPGVSPPDAPGPHRAGFFGALMAFTGVVFLTTESGTGMHVLSGLHRGEWLSLGCAVAFALHLLTLAHAAPRVPARALGTLQIVVAAAVMALSLPAEPHPHLHWSASLGGALLLTAVLATAAAFTVQSWAQQHLPPTHTALILTLEPVFAAAVSILFLGEHLDRRALAGAALILAGIVLSELGPTVLSRAGILPMEP